MYCHGDNCPTDARITPRIKLIMSWVYFSKRIERSSSSSDDEDEELDDLKYVSSFGENHSDGEAVFQIRKIRLNPHYL